MYNKNDQRERETRSIAEKLMKAIKVESDGYIKLPKEMLRLFPTSSELAVWTEGDMIVLKRLRPLKPSMIAERVPDAGPSLAEISDEVHRARRESRKRRG